MSLGPQVLCFHQNAVHTESKQGSMDHGGEVKGKGAVGRRARLPWAAQGQRASLPSLPSDPGDLGIPQCDHIHWLVPTQGII